MTRAPLWHYGEGIPPDFSVISWNFFKIFLLKKGLISGLRMPPHLPSYLIRALRYSSQNIRLFANYPYWPHGQHIIFRMQMSYVMSLLGSSMSARWPVWRTTSNIFEYFKSNYSALLSDNRANKVASCRY